MENLNELANVAVLAAKEARNTVKKFIESGFKIDMKGPANLVTEADLAAEKIIVETIKKTYPEHSFLGEEKVKAETNAENLWVIDPIDGTTNFTHDVPVVGISIAFSHKGEVVVGCVLNPFTDDLYLAIKGKGSTLNDKPIKVSSAEKISDSLIATGFYYGLGNDLNVSLDVIKTLIDKECHGIRRMGAASIDLCYVASGKFDAYFELKLNCWDFAAGMLLVREAGGIITNPAGIDLTLNDSQLIASNTSVHPHILAILNERKSS